MSTFVASAWNASMFEGRGEGRSERSSRIGIKHFNKGMKIGNNTKFLHSSNASIVNMQPKRKWLILECTWGLQCNDGTTSRRNCKRSFMPRCQETRKCAKSNGMDWIPIIRNFQIITKESNITHLSWNWPWRSATSFTYLKPILQKELWSNRWISKERIIFTSIHVWDLQAKGDANYTTPILDSEMQEDQNSIKLSSFMEDFMGNEHPTP